MIKHINIGEGDEDMKYYKSKIGEYAFRYEPVNGYKRKDGVIIPPHYKIVKYHWKKKAM